jgi:predicted nucleotide-binding protein
MKTTGEETNALVLIASDGHSKRVSNTAHAGLYHKKLITSQGQLTDAGKEHLRTIASAMTASRGKRTYTVRKSIVLKGRNMEVGETFEASPAGTHVQRWLSEGRIA